MFSLPIILSFALLALVQAQVDNSGAPAAASGVKTITSPGGVTIRYKEPGQDGICETTDGVGSYSGYVDLDEDTHMFFYFFEARKNPLTAPFTLWLNGGPGSDSLIGLFQELGPCSITEDLKTKLNPYAWNEESNLLFLSQPIGVGFSYSTLVSAQNSIYGSVSSQDLASTTQAAAVGCWHILQGFLANLPQMDPTINIRDFNLWTESYGGHYGPSFFSYFSDQNAAIANGTQTGVQLTMATLGIGNGIIDELIQGPFYAEFAVNNTYGIKAVSDQTYLRMKAAFSDPGMCKDQLLACGASIETSAVGQAICVNASETCRTFVEEPYYDAGNNPYDIRPTVPMPPDYYLDFLNLAKTQNSLGVSMNYTDVNRINTAFSRTGDFVFNDFVTELGNLLSNGVRVALYSGDADYICNWFGGQAVSLQVNYTHSAEFRAAGYAPFVVNGTEYGEVRQYGNFSFLRIYNSGHLVPYYQSEAALELFRRVLGNLAVADGSDLTATYGSSGTANATHVEAAGMASVTSGSGGSGTTSTSAGTAVTPTKSPSSGRRRVHRIWDWS